MLVGLVVAVAVGLGARYLLFAIDQPDPNADVEEIARVEAFLDAGTESLNGQDLDAVRALMTEDGMAYGVRVEEEGVLGFTEQAGGAWTTRTRTRTCSLSAGPSSMTATGSLDPAYDVVAKVTASDRDSGDVQGTALEYYHIATDADGELRLHHASVLNWTLLRSYGLRHRPEPVMAATRAVSMTEDPSRRRGRARESVGSVSLAPAGETDGTTGRACCWGPPADSAGVAPEIAISEPPSSPPQRSADTL